MDAKFAVGDKVDQSPRDKFVGTVKAVFTTKEGETRYAVAGWRRRPLAWAGMRPRIERTACRKQKVAAPT
jgi:hypothetical protein